MDFAAELGGGGLWILLLCPNTGGCDVEGSGGSDGSGGGTVRAGLDVC